MHNNGLVVSLKTENGEVLAEQKGLVHVPFGTIYQIYLKNTDKKRDICATVLIDNERVFDNTFFIPANSSLVIKGDRNDFSFKFLNKTDDIRSRRNNKNKDSSVEVTFQFVKPDMAAQLKEVMDKLNTIQEGLPRGPSAPYIPYIPSPPYNNQPWTDPWSTPTVPYPDPFKPFVTFCVTDTVSPSTNTTCELTTTDSTLYSYTSTTTDVALKPSQAGDGITGRGDRVAQEFEKVQIGELDAAVYSVKLFLTGLYDDLDIPVKTVKTTRARITCELCGTRQSSQNNYCHKCGTCLLAQ